MIDMILLTDTETLTYECPCGETLKVEIDDGDGDPGNQESTALQENGWRFRGGRYHCAECAIEVPDPVEDYFDRIDARESYF